MILDEKKIRYTFSKEESLTNKKLIKQLFEKGSHFHLYPLKVLYLKCKRESTPKSQVLFVVPKRNFRLAVARNKLKRRLREAYRCNKHLLISDKVPCPLFLIAYIYVGKESVSYKEIEGKLKDSLLRLKKVES